MKSTILEPSTEREILERVETYFRRKGFDIAPQIRIRTWIPDLVATKGKDIIIVEVKGVSSDLRKAMATTLLYGTDATSAYLAVPKSRLTNSLREAAEALGVGLLGVNDKVQVAVRPQRTSPRPSFARRIGGIPRPSEDEIGQRKIQAGRPSFDILLRHRVLLQVLMKDPERRFTIRELAIQSGKAYSTTWRIVETLRSIGVVSLERVGQNQSVVVNKDSPFLAELGRIRSASFSPHVAAARQFAERIRELPQVKKAILFGSVAERRESPESDIDIALLTAKRTPALVSRVRAIASEVEDLTRLRIMPIFVSPSELRSNDQLAGNIMKGEVLFERS